MLSPSLALASSGPGATRDGALDLGDITALTSPRFPKYDLDLNDGDTLHWFSFSLSERREANLGLRQLDADADLFLEDDAGTNLAESRNAGTANEKIKVDLDAGDYYIRVEAKASGANRYALRHGTSEPTTEPDPPPTTEPEPVVTDADAVRSGAVDLGDITAVTRMRYPTYELDGDQDAVDWFRFDIAEHRFVAVGVRQLDAAVRLTLEDDDGNEIASKSSGSSSSAMFYGTRLAGTYWLKVQAAETGDNIYRLAHRTSAPVASKLQELLDRLSDNADLSALSLSGVDIGDFSSGTREYSAKVANSVMSTTVIATAANAYATVTITPDDADTADGHQVSLSEGITTVTVTVESSDGTAQAIYTVSVARASTAAFGWNHEKDLVVGDVSPFAVHTDGTTMWVTDWLQDDILAYVLATGDRDADKDIDAGFPFDGRGLWSDGTTMWALNGFYRKILAFDLATGDRDADKDITTLVDAGNRWPWGLWSDGTTVWVADSLEKKVYAYELDGGERVPGKDIQTNFRQAPRGLWSNGTTMWVSQHLGNVYAFDLATGDRDPSLDFETLAAAGNRVPYGLTSDGTTLWVADYSASGIFAYNLP